MTFVFSTSTTGSSKNLDGPSFSIGGLSVSDATAFLGAWVARVDKPDTSFQIVFVNPQYKRKAPYHCRTFQKFLDAGNRISWSL